MRTRGIYMLVVASLAVAVGGCGDSAKSSSPPTSLNTGTIHIGTHTIYTRTRISDGTPETTYIHPGGPVSSANTRHVVTGEMPHAGVVLLDGAEHALYAFVPSKHGPSACTGACATVWPPLRITIEGTVDASPILEESLVGTEPDPENHRVGDRIVKFDGRVVHTYTGDTAPRMAAGQGLSSYGGHWYLISPSGKLVTSTGG